MSNYDNSPYIKINGYDNDAYSGYAPVSYTHLRAHETGRNLVCRLLLEKKKNIFFRSCISD